MACQNLDISIGKDSRAMLKEVKNFTGKIMRPAGTKLDLLSDPADVIENDAVIWDVYRAHRQLDLHLLGIAGAMGGLAEEVDTLTTLLIIEQMGYADSGLAAGLALSGMPFRFASKFQISGWEETVKAYCEDKACELIGCAAVNTLQKEDFAGKDRVRAVKKGTDCIINGKLTRVPNASIATHAAIPVTLESSGADKRSALAVIPLALPGISREEPLEQSGQRPLNIASLVFQETEIPGAYIIAGDDADADKICKMAAAEAGGITATVFAGLAMAAYDEAMEYAQQRIQGGVPVFEHKNIRLQLFHMFKIVEAARANARRIAIYNYENPDSFSPAHAAAAKCLSTETAARIVDEAIQIFGGNGLAKEYPLEKMFRDVRAGMAEAGGNDDQGLSMVKYL